VFVVNTKGKSMAAINEYLRPIRERRAQLDDASMLEILDRGAEQARDVASATIREVKDAMGWR